MRDEKMSNTRQHHGRPYIIITNDDGVMSPGLHALASSIVKFADIRIIAPSHQMTATGRGLIGERDAQFRTTELEIDQETITAYHAPCSPAHIVLLGLQIFVPERQPDLLISGINYGENMGRDISMSGTIGAAIQSVCMGIPALAVSLQTPIHFHFLHGETEWSAAACFAARFARLMLDRSLPDDVEMLKVDVPDSATEDTPWQVTRMARQSYFTAEIKNPVINSRLSDAEVTALRDPENLVKGTDIHTVVVEEKVSVTPLSLDYTSRTDLERLQAYLNNDKY